MASQDVTTEPIAKGIAEGGADQATVAVALPSVVHAFATGDFSDPRIPAHMKTALQNAHANATNFQLERFRNAYKAYTSQNEGDIFEIDFCAKLAGKIVETVMKKLIKNPRSDLLSVALGEAVECIIELAMGGDEAEALSAKFEEMDTPRLPQDASWNYRHSQGIIWLLNHTRTLEGEDLDAMHIKILKTIVRSYKMAVTEAVLNASRT